VARVYRWDGDINGGTCTAQQFGQQAVIIGGSLAGLVTARVLADHFDTVTVLERDHLIAAPWGISWSAMPMRLVSHSRNTNGTI
jgi:cation diffusion facilitator CzcD-associated flavoprotein CzcO